MDIRNFVIIAHIDSGKSTLADRFLEMTGTIPMRSMQPQYLDRLPLERERGITIKMAPVRMDYELNGKKYILNLIDTPGHSDFSYEVSRALAAVEGAILLIDGTRGIQAQTLSNLRSANKANLKIIPVINKIDLASSHIENVLKSVSELLNISPENILKVSAKTGDGVKNLLENIAINFSSPSENFLLSSINSKIHFSRALIFDSFYDDHKGIIAFVRVFEGEFSASNMKFIASGVSFKAKEVGFLKPSFTVSDVIKEGEIGYIATGLKEPASVKIGDTIISASANGKPFFEIKDSANESSLAFRGYKDPSPVVFISFYPDGATKFDDLKKAFEKLHLNDAALNIEPDSNEALGRGLKVGFLGQLHFEITSDRLLREYNLEFITSFPSIAYRVLNNGKEEIIKQPQDFPEKPEKVWEPIVSLEILAPEKYLNSIVNLQTVFDIEISQIKNLGENLLIEALMPLRELIRDFDDRLKSISQGYASFTYELSSEREAEVEKLEIMVVGEVVPALTRIVPKKDIEKEGRQTVERLKELLPKEQFSQAIQASSMGRIIARETITAMKKELGNFGKNGGDRTRKMKLWKKQQRGKKRLEGSARVELSPEVFREILKK